MTVKIKMLYPMIVDEKMANLNAAGIHRGFQIELFSRKSPRNLFIAFVRAALRGPRPHALVVRYMNTSPALIRTLVRVAFTLATVLTAKITSIKVIWLLHNVDRETSSYYPLLAKCLRTAVGEMSSAIFVTDPLLVPVASGFYPKWAHKIDYITFGVRKQSADRYSNQLAVDETSRIKNIIAEIRAADEDAKIGFCPTAGADKCAHLRFAPALAGAADKLGVNVHLLIVGRLEQYLESRPALKRQLIQSPRIHLIQRFVQYDPVELACHIDFYWRALSDQSISYTLYEAACVRRPILTTETGFLPKAIHKYELGARVSTNMANLAEALAALAQWEPLAADQFLETHSWEVAAARLARRL